MNDHRSHRRRSSGPAWPTGDDPDAPAQHQAPERTGFWSPLWEDDDDDELMGRRPNGHANGAHGAHHPRANGVNGANGRGSHRLSEPDPRGAHHPGPPAHRPPARPAPPPAWPSEEPPPVRPGGPPTGGRPPVGQSTRVVRPRPGGPARPGPGGPGGPGDIPDDPTEMLPPVHGFHNPEPQLLTHRELDYDEGLYRDPESGTGHALEEGLEEEAGPLTDDQRRRRRKKIWRRVRRTAYVFIALMIIGPMVAFFVAYQMVEVPSPESVREKQGQVVTLTYADKTQLSKVVPPGGENRTIVEYDDIPKDVLNAVFAAEDAEFMTNPGFDIGGVARAGWNQLTGGQGGGSTITQQYVKKATGKEEKTPIRKALEVVTAYKMNNTYNKEKIITAYLNTVYFGRSAYGISAAAQAYYGKTLDKVTASEAALLAGMIQNPSRYKEQDYMERRWSYVMDQMVDKGWFPAEKRAAEPFPKRQPLEKSRPQALTGPRAHIQARVFDELAERADITEDELHQKGLTVR
ncbi:MAG TPA: biosynthetic peptidoglycan transglycosylase, partial [Actinophytocola sp.]|nr:biosynthetic peptidoglycan transglycosylase [Actinophytocola sp.]